jgi:UDP-N-acetylmuramate dehydrogenase
MSESFYKEALQILDEKEIKCNYPIGKLSWMKAGGAADFFVQPESVEKLILFLDFLQKNMFLGENIDFLRNPQNQEFWKKTRNADAERTQMYVSTRVPDRRTKKLIMRSYEKSLMMLGAMSNILVRDGGVRGVVINLAKCARGVGFPEDPDSSAITLGAGVTCSQAFLEAQKRGLSGMEFLIGIPGTIGGAIFMNAGAHGTEIRDIIDWVDVITLKGGTFRVAKDDLNMQYRNGNFSATDIIIQAGFVLQKGDKAGIYDKGMRFLQERSAKFPIGGGIGTAGSTFKNPPPIPGAAPKLAWQLIDEAGCRGMKLGNAMVSEKHANFIINLGGASASDIEDLGEKIRAIVFDKSGIILEWEIRRIGQRSRDYT